MRKRYLFAAAISIILVGLGIWLLTSPRWLIDKRGDGYGQNVAIRSCIAENGFKVCLKFPSLFLT